MGKSIRTLSVLTVLLAAALGSASVFLSAQDSGAAVSLSRFVLPQYGGNNHRLQFIVSGSKATNMGALVELYNPIIDLVKDHITDINIVKPLLDVKPYPLNAPESEFKAFWADKQHSRASIFSTHAVFDKNSKLLRGNDFVHFRSRELDIDGVGFDAYYEKKLVHIRSRVKVVIRAEYARRSTGMEEEAAEPELNSKQTGTQK